MKRSIKKSQLGGVLVLGVMILVAVVAVIGLSNTVVDIKQEMLSETPTAILASAGVKNLESIQVPVLYYDQRADDCVNLYDEGLRSALLSRQFEWSSCGYDKRDVEQGLVDFYLGSNGFPVGVGGQLTSNRGVKNIERWYGEVDGKSKKVVSALALDYVETEMKFSFESDAFYPLDATDFSNGDAVNSDGHNHLFTMSLAVPFRVLGSGDERFSVEADDDTFVFIDDKLVIDMGGTHDAVSGSFWINEKGEVYSGIAGGDQAYTGVKVDINDDAIIRIFHADRNASESVFKIGLYGIEPKVMNSQIADSEGVQVAYDPEDPLHAVPLGVSMNVKQDNKKSYVAMATIYSMVIIAAAIGVVMFSHYLLRKR